MQLQNIAEHIVYYTNCFNSVAVAISTESALTLLNGPLPSCCVVPLESSATPNASLTMSKQFVTETFAIIVVMKQTSREGFDVAVFDFTTIQGQLNSAFLGWRSSSLSYKPISAGSPPWTILADDQGAAKSYVNFNFTEELSYNSNDIGWDRNTFRIANIVVTTQNTINTNVSVTNAWTGNAAGSYILTNGISVATVITPAS